jgi:ppGpp synthetase/RelA/SpoT-type nucleotidyltranferase
MKFDRGFVRAEFRKGVGTLWDAPGINECFELCFDAHDGQYRETSDPNSNDLPYILHPVGVAILCVKNYDSDHIKDPLETVVMAALAHDVFEDTDASPSDLTSICGERVTELVSIMTKPQVRVGEDHQDRNARFREQIIGGGTTAMFIKLCDSMHNLSRPQASPSKLMKKAVKKARADYGTFFEEGFVYPEFKKVYFGRVQETATFLVNARVRSGVTIATTLEAALDAAFRSRQTKALEIHDLVTFLEETVGVTYCRLFTPNGLLDELVDGDDLNAKQTRANLFGLIEQGEVGVDRLPKAMRRTSIGKDVEKLFFYPLKNLTDLRGASDQILVAGINSESVPDWVNWRSLSVLLTYLSEKIREVSRNEFIELARSASNLGIDVSVEDLSAAQMSYPRLLRLRNALKGGEYLQNFFVNEISCAVENYDGLGLALPLESRVKDVASLLRKMVRRKFVTLTAIDDLLGIRLVGLNEQQCALLMHACEEIAMKKVSDNSQFPQFVRIDTKAGYQAYHMTFECFGLTENDRPIGCEFQVRTLYEDAWARASGAVQYKASTKAKRQNSKVLKELAELRDRCQILANELK